MKNQKKKYQILAILLISVFLLMLLIGCVFYISDYYPSEDSVKPYLSDTEKVKLIEFKDGILFDGLGEDTALIFYPGAKIEYTAYAPLLYKLAEEGIDCFLIHMPYNLAVLGQNKADNILNAYSYKKWYIAGHSLGGAMATSYASKNLEQFRGVILLAAYPTKSLNIENLAVLSIYGSEDKVINLEKLETGRDFMPQNYREICIEGGNHAGFGNYGKQKGDGAASIPAEQQQAQTIEEILGMMKEK